MKRLSLVVSIMFLSLTRISFAEGIEIDAGAIFLGKTEIEMIGTNTPKDATVTISPNNEISFAGSAGYVFDFHERFSIKGALGFTYYNTESLQIPGTAVTSDYAGRIIDLQLIMQFDLTNEWGIRLGTNLPLTMTIEGSLDNDTTNLDEFTLDSQSLGFIAGVSYNFSKHLFLRSGFVMNLAEKTAGNNLELRVNCSYFNFLVGYQF